MFHSMFQSFKLNKRFSALTTEKEENGVPVTDICDRPMQCEGGVQNAGFMDCFYAAISGVHKHADNDGHYYKECPGCREASSEAGVGGCLRHNSMSVQPKMNVGNPMRSHAVKTAVQHFKDRFTESKYRTDKKSPLYPSDINIIHRVIKDGGYALSDFQQCVMMLLGIHTAARFHTYSSFTTDDFNDNRHHWTATQTFGIHGVHVSLKEKADQDRAIYNIPFQKAVPQRCTLRHLLTCLHVTQTHKGHIFPPFETLCEANRKANLMVKTKAYLDNKRCLGHAAETCVSRDYHCHWLLKMREHLPSKEVIYLVPHSLRCTACVLMFLGGAEPQTAVKEARHRDLKIAQRYQADALAVVAAIFENPRLAEINIVETFHPNIVCGEGENMMRVLSHLDDRIYFNNTHEVARHFVEKQLNVLPGDSNYMNWRFLLHKSYGLPMGPGLRQDKPLWNQIQENVKPQHQSSFVMAYHLEMDDVRKKSFEEGRLQGRQEAIRKKTSGSTPNAPQAKKRRVTTSKVLAASPSNDTARTPSHAAAAAAVIEDDDTGGLRPAQIPLPVAALDRPTSTDDGELLTSSPHSNDRFLPDKIIGLINKICRDKADALDKLRIMDKLSREIMDLTSALHVRDPVDKFAAGKGALLKFIPEKDKGRRERLKKFFSRTLFPVVRCLHNCHSGNVCSLHQFLYSQPQFKFRSSSIAVDNHCPRCRALKDGKPTPGPKPNKA